MLRAADAVERENPALARELRAKVEGSVHTMYYAVNDPVLEKVRKKKSEFLQNGWDEKDIQALSVNEKMPMLILLEDGKSHGEREIWQKPSVTIWSTIPVCQGP